MNYFFYQLIILISIPFLLIYYLTKTIFIDKNYLRLIIFKLFPKLEVKPLLFDYHFHAVSVGELYASVDLINHLKLNNKILITTTTPSGQEQARNKFDNHQNVIIKYLPYDFHFIINIFLKVNSSKKLVLMETEIWPSLIYCAKKNNTKIFLINARLSKKSFKKYFFFQKFTKQILIKIDHVLCQTSDDQKRFKCLGAKNTQITGSIKFDKKLYSAYSISHITNKLNKKKSLIVTLGSLRGNEYKIFLENNLFIECADHIIIAPRHLNNIDRIVRKIKKINFGYVLLSSLNTFNRDCPKFIICDSFGSLPMLYRISNISFIGGSFVDKGGQNFVESIYSKCPTFIGPSIFNFQYFSDLAQSFGCLKIVNNINEFNHYLTLLSEDKMSLNKMKTNGMKFAKEIRGAIKNTLNIINR